MNKIESQIRRYGLSQDELPTPVISKIEELESLLNDIDGATADLEEETDEEAKSEMKSKIAEGKEYAQELQSEIILHIQTFARKKAEAEQSQRKPREVDAKARQRQREAQQNVAARNVAPRNVAPRNVAPRNVVSPIKSNRIPQNSSNTPAATNDDAAKPKKSNKTLAWIIGGAVLVLTLGAVNTLSNK